MDVLVHGPGSLGVLGALCGAGALDESGSEPLDESGSGLLEHMAFISSATYLNGCPAPVGLWGGLGAQVMHTAHDKHSGSHSFCGEQELEVQQESD